MTRNNANRATSLLLCHNKLSLARELEGRLDAKEQTHKDKIIIPERLAEAVMELGFPCHENHSPIDGQEGSEVAGRSGRRGDSPPTPAA